MRSRQIFDIKPANAFFPAAISSLSTFVASASRSFSYSVNSPSGCTSSTPLGPNVTFDVKKSNPSTTLDFTYAHSVLLSPAKPAKTAFPKRAPAYAMDSVALPLPPFAFTTSVPASCTRLSKAFTFASGTFRPAGSCEKSGNMVTPACPPTTGMLMSAEGTPVTSCTNLLERTQSKVVTPQIRLLSRLSWVYNSAIAGTTEFTGLTISPMIAFGQNFAQASTKSLAIPMLTLSKSARSMPGLRGTPAGMSTKWQSLKHSSR
mmetsp:Transcript_90746/g.277834  ORF Transcript_90746/g.277834 Transcript_90746/m.277834 type:complete len:261 (-) Transcript_90746:306-1088(-)